MGGFGGWEGCVSEGEVLGLYICGMTRRARKQKICYTVSMDITKKYVSL